MRSRDAVHFRHINIKDDQVRSCPFCAFYCFTAICSFLTVVDVESRSQRGLDYLSDDCIVVGNEDMFLHCSNLHRNMFCQVPPTLLELALMLSQISLWISSRRD